MTDLRCKVCGGEWLGGERLGRMIWLKCRDCGSWMGRWAGEPGDEDLEEMNLEGETDEQAF